MLHYSAVFLSISIVASMFGFSLISDSPATIANVLLLVVVVVLVVSELGGRWLRF